MNYLIILNILFFVIFWIILCYLLSFLGGWKKLSDNNSYVENISLEKKSFYFQSMKIGFFVNYNNCVNIIVDHTGILLNVFFIFRINHSPIYIRFDNMEEVSINSLFGLKTLSFKIGDKKLRIKGSAVKVIEEILSNRGS